MTGTNINIKGNVTERKTHIMTHITKHYDMQQHVAKDTPKVNLFNSTPRMIQLSVFATTYSHQPYCTLAI